MNYWKHRNRAQNIARSYEQHIKSPVRVASTLGVDASRNEYLIGFFNTVKAAEHTVREVRNVGTVEQRIAATRALNAREDVPPMSAPRDSEAKLKDILNGDVKIDLDVSEIEHDDYISKCRAENAARRAAKLARS